MIIQLPNGGTAEFPDNMSTGEIESVLQKQFAPAATPDATAATLSTPVEGTLKDIGKGMVNQLPLAGGLAGGALGAGAGVLGSPAGAILGAGIGAGARNWINQGLGITPPKLPTENWRDMAQEGVDMGVAEAGGPFVAKGIQSITSPFAGKVAQIAAENPASREAVKLVEQGAPISPDVVNPNIVPQWFTWAADKLWPANSIMARYRSKLPELAQSLADEFAASRNLFSTSKNTVNEAWDKWAEMAGGPDAQYTMPYTTKLLKEYLGKPQGKFGTLWKQDVPAFLESSQREVIPKAVSDQIDSINSRLGQMPTAFTPEWQTLYDQKTALLGQASQPNTYSVQAIRDLFNVLNPANVKGAQKTSRMKVADAIMEDLGASGNSEMVDALQQARDMGRIQKIASPLQWIFNKASNNENVRTGMMEFDPDVFTNLWKQQRGKFLENKNYSPEDIQVIDAFADKMKALVPDLARLKTFNPSLNQLNFQNPLPVLGMVYAKPYTAIPVGADAGLAFSLMKPNGIMRKFLTTGFNPPTLSTKVGIQKGLEATQ